MTLKSFRRLFTPYFLVEKHRNPIGTSNPPEIFNENGEKMIWAYISADQKKLDASILRKTDETQLIFWDQFDYELPVQVYVDEKIALAENNDKRKFAVCSEKQYITEPDRFEMIFSENEDVLKSFSNAKNLKNEGKTLEEYLKEIL